MSASPTRWRGWRWLKRGVLGVLGLIVLVVGAALIALHTDWGRGIVRTQVEARLQGMFRGGATLGRIEGSVFTELVIRDLVINGPDKQPAIKVKTLKVAVALMPLLSQQARVGGVIAEDVDVDLRRDASGGLQISNLMIPATESKSTWSVDLPRIQLRRAHIRFDAGSEVMNFDNLALDARVKLPYNGPVDASLELSAAWRERTAAPLLVRTVLRRDDRGLAVPYLVALAGDVVVAGDHINVGTAAPGQAPVIAGSVFVDATAAAVERLVPTLHLPADVSVSVTARPVEGQPWTDLVVSGYVDRTPVQLTGSADMTAKHVRGQLTTGTLALTKLSGGKLVGTGAVTTAVFDVRPGGAETLPIATATIRGWAEVADVPKTSFTIDLNSAGERARVAIDADGAGVQAKISGTVRTAGELLAIEDGSIFAQTSDPQRASGGKAPLRGSLKVNLKASGQIKPKLSMAVAGTIDGRHLRMQDMSVAQLHVTLDAAKLPNRPYGKAHVQMIDLVRGDMRLGALTVDATDRTDGKVAVQIRSHPARNPWLIDADLLVTPPADAGLKSVAVDVVSHRVRGNGTDWTGRGGRVEIVPQRITVRDLSTASAAGRLAVDASYIRAGRGQGDLTAKVDATGVKLDSFARAYHGQVDAHVAVSRRSGRWDGEVRVDATGVSLDPKTAMLDSHVRAKLHGTELSVEADATSLGLGSMKLALALDAPARVEDARAWQRLGRDAIRTGQLTLQGVEIRKAAELAGLEGVYGGRLDGDLQISATTIGGRIEARSIEAPALRGLTGVNAVLDLSQPAPTEIVPTVTVTADGIGQIVAQAQLRMPERQFDAVAWKQLGRAALQGATVQAENIQVDPAMLDRLGVVSEMRAKISVAVELGAEARTLDAKLHIAELRGAPIDQPVDLQVAASINERETTATIALATQGSALVDVQAKSPLTITKLLDRGNADPEAIKAMPIQATATLDKLDAVKLLAVFGRSEILAGVIDGKVEIAGTIGAPTVEATVVASGIKVPPGRRNKPVRTVDKLTIAASWDGTTAKLNVDGDESDGGKLQIVGQAKPSRLADGTVTIKATKFDLVPLLAFLPGPAGGAAGTLDANLTMKGLDIRTTQLSGEVHLVDGRIPIAPAVGTLRRAKIDAIIADRQIRFAVDGRMGQGTVVASGAIALDGAAPNGGNAKITLRKVSPIGSVEPEITADITATLTRTQNQWKANLVVDRGLVVVSTNRGEALKPVGAPTDMVFANGNRVTRRPMDKEVPTNPIFLVAITLNPTRIESEEFRGLLRGKLELRADGEAIGLVGSIAADRGDLDLFGHRYYVERAGVSFDGSIDPLLDVRITHDFPEVTTITQVRGRISAPELTMTSDPGTYSQGQLLGFLLGGDPGGDPQNSSATDKVAGAGTSFVANKLGGYVKSALPIDIDVLRYEAASATGSAAVTVGTWVTHTLFLAYRQHLSARPGENSSEGNLEYWMTRRLMLEGTAGDRGINGLDLLWRRRY